MINNEGFDALAQGMSALERGLCETVYTVNMMYVHTWLKCALWGIIPSYALWSCGRGGASVIE